MYPRRSHCLKRSNFLGYIKFTSAFSLPALVIKRANPDMLSMSPVMPCLRKLLVPAVASLSSGELWRRLQQYAVKQQRPINMA